MLGLFYDYKRKIKSDTVIEQRSFYHFIYFTSPQISDSTRKDYSIFQSQPRIPL